MLHNVHPSHELRLKNGRTIKNLYELASVLATIDKTTFEAHVNDDKNDLQQWVFHIVRDNQLAQTLSAIRDRRLMLEAVQKRIAQLEQQSASTLPLHLTAKHYLLGMLVGALAMLALSRIL